MKLFEGVVLLVIGILIGILAGIPLGAEVKQRTTANPCATTYVQNNHKVCVLNTEWGAFIR